MSDATTPGNVHPITDAVKKAFREDRSALDHPAPVAPGEYPQAFGAADAICEDDIWFGDSYISPDDDTPFGPPVTSSMPTPAGPAGAECALYSANAVFRVLSVIRTPDAQGKMHNRATLFLDDRTYEVDWITQKADIRIRPDVLVTVLPAATFRPSEGLIRIQRLRLADYPRANVNLFATVPPRWTADRELVARASNLWEGLPRNLGLLVNAVLWNGERFHRYVMGPSSIKDHHLDLGGNFRHSVEVAELARDLGTTSKQANVPLLIVGGLLHDAAKAVEYRLDRATRRFRLSDRGELVGHRDTLIGWLAEARRTHGVNLGDELFLGLLHMLFAAKGAPDWLGLRAPRTREADILSQADQFSRSEYLREACSPPGGQSGFGRYHHNLGHRTYVTPKVLV